MQKRRFATIVGSLGAVLCASPAVSLPANAPLWGGWGGRDRGPRKPPPRQRQPPPRPAAARQAGPAAKPAGPAEPVDPELQAKQSADQQNAELQDAPAEPAPAAPEPTTRGAQSNLGPFEFHTDKWEEAYVRRI